MRNWRIRIAIAGVLAVVLVGAIVVAVRMRDQAQRVHLVGYFANSTGVFAGDDVRILGVPVGKIDSIEPQGARVKVTFWYDNMYRVPADAKAVILSPSLVSARAIQMTPVYTGGPAMANNSVIPLARTAVPVEWDDVRRQLSKLTTTLQPTEPGGVSTLGALVDTAADNLRGRGASIRDTLIQLSQAFSALGDHSDDLFATIRNLSTLVSALQNSTEVIQSLNRNLATVTSALSNDPNEIGRAVGDLNAVVGDVRSFVQANRDTVGTASQRLASISTALVQSLDDIKQTLHIAPNTVQNFANIYHPAHGAISGALVVNTFANPITFICGAIQAASRLNAEQSAKLCAQYLAPIVKNRQYNFLPFGLNPFVGALARPNEITYTEDWLRPDYVPPQPKPDVPTVSPAHDLGSMMMPEGQR